MTNTESHKSVAVEMPVYTVLKKVAEREFRSPSKQLAYMLSEMYPREWEDSVDFEPAPQPEPQPQLLEKPRNIIMFPHPTISGDNNAQTRTWQVLLCLLKNKGFGPMTTSQLAQALKYGDCAKLSSTLSRPREIGLIRSRPIREGSKTIEWQLTPLGSFIAKMLSEERPVRITNDLVDSYTRMYSRGQS